VTGLGAKCALCLLLVLSLVGRNAFPQNSLADLSASAIRAGVVIGGVTQRLGLGTPSLGPGDFTLREFLCEGIEEVIIPCWWVGYSIKPKPDGFVAAVSVDEGQLVYFRRPPSKDLGKLQQPVFAKDDAIASAKAWVIKTKGVFPSNVALEHCYYTGDCRIWTIGWLRRHDSYDVDEERLYVELWETEKELVLTELTDTMTSREIRIVGAVSLSEAQMEKEVLKYGNELARIFRLPAGRFRVSASVWKKARLLRPLAQNLTLSRHKSPVSRMSSRDFVPCWIYDLRLDRTDSIWHWRAHVICDATTGSLYETTLGYIEAGSLEAD